MKRWSDATVLKWTHGLECHRNTGLSVEMQSAKYICSKQRYAMRSYDHSWDKMVSLQHSKVFEEWFCFIWLEFVVYTVVFLLSCFSKCVMCLLPFQIMGSLLCFASSLCSLFCFKNQSLLHPFHCLLSVTFTKIWYVVQSPLKYLGIPSSSGTL